MIQLFNDLRENRRIAVDSNDQKSLKAQKRWKSMPGMELQTNAAADEQNKMPFVLSTEVKGSMDSMYAVSINNAVITPRITELIDVDTSCTPVKPVESDAQHFSLIQNMIPQLIGDAAESKNSLTIQPGYETASLQEMVTGGYRGDAVEMDNAALLYRGHT